MSSRLDDYPITVQRDIAWGQMDAFQHVNNVEYFRFFEDVRIAYFEAMEIYDASAADLLPPKGPILGATSCQYLAPLRYPDQIEIGTRLTDISEKRFTLEYAIASETTGGIAAVGDSAVVAYDYDHGQAIAIPDRWREAINEIEGAASAG